MEQKSTSVPKNYFNRCLLSSLQENALPLNSVLQIDAIIVYFDRFLNMGFLFHLTLSLFPTFLLSNED